MQTVSSFKYRPNSQISQPKTQQGSWEDILPGAGGLIGSLFQPEGLLPGAATSGAGGAIGETARQGIRAATGRGFDTGQIARSTGEQAAYGAIPGGQELRRIPMAGKLAGNIFGRTALRAGTGVLGGAAAQQIANFGGQGQNPLATGGMVGAINAISPALGGALNLGGTGLRKLSSSSRDIAGEFAARKAAPVLENIQSFLGKQALTMSKGEAKMNDFSQKMVDEYKFILPPHGDPQILLDTIKEAQSKVGGQLTPFLDRFKIAYSKEISPIVKNNLVKYFGTTQLGTKFKAIPPEAKNLAVQFSKAGNSPSLSEIKKLQQQAADLVKTKDWSEPKDTTDQFGISIYKQFDDLIRSQLAKAQQAGKLSPEEYGLYNDLMKQAEWLVHAKQATQHTMGGFTKLPKSATSESIAKGQSQMGFLGPERIKQAALRAALLGGTVGGTALGVPKEITLPLMALEAASLIPYGGENVARGMAKGEGAMGNILQKPGQNFNRALQQLGVRLPSLQ